MLPINNNFYEMLMMLTERMGVELSWTSDVNDQTMRDEGVCPPRTRSCNI